MNELQVKNLYTALIATFGGVIAGWFAKTGWITTEQMVSILNGPTFSGLVVSGLMAIVGLWLHRTPTVVAAVDRMPEVQGVVTKDTVAGVKLANEVPSPTVAPAGTLQAAAVAETTKQ